MEQVTHKPSPPLSTVPKEAINLITEVPHSTTTTIAVYAHASMCRSTNTEPCYNDLGYVCGKRPMPVTMKDSVELPFIVSTCVAKPDSRTQRFIRSHVMKGKNKGKAYYIRRKGTATSASAGVLVDAESPGQGPTIWDYRPLGFIPKRVGSELSFVPFADEIDSSLAVPVVKCKHNGPLYYPEASFLNQLTPCKSYRYPRRLYSHWKGV